jgi:CelD/BcsL family acetyltransferase involved in cellulose biosynthesis
MVSTRAQFDALGDDWNDLFERAGCSSQVFQTFNWNWHWANHFLCDTPNSPRLAIVTGRVDGRLAMVWPVAIEPGNRLRSLVWMGEPVSQYGDVLVEEGPCRLAMLRAGWQFLGLNVKPDIARLGKTRADAAVAPLLAELRAISTVQLAAPFLDLKSAPTFEAYAERYSMKARKNRRRQMRRLEEDGPVCMRLLEPGEEACRLMGEIFAMKQAWLDKKALISSALSDERTLAFFKAVSAAGPRSPGTRLSALMCGDVLAAASVGFICRERAAIHIITYDRAFEKAGAGALMLERTIAASLQAGVGVFDMLAPANAYKKEWADGAVEVNDFAVPFSMAGRAYIRGYLEFVRPTMRAALLAMPLPARRAIKSALAMGKARNER